MAGYSKFINIKHRKAAQAAKCGKVCTKSIRELEVAVKEGVAILVECMTDNVIPYCGRNSSSI